MSAAESPNADWRLVAQEGFQHVAPPAASFADALRLRFAQEVIEPQRLAWQSLADTLIAYGRDSYQGGPLIHHAPLSTGLLLLDAQYPYSDTVTVQMTACRVQAPRYYTAQQLPRSAIHAAQRSRTQARREHAHTRAVAALARLDAIRIETFLLSDNPESFASSAQTPFAMFESPAPSRFTQFLLSEENNSHSGRRAHTKRRKEVALWASPLLLFATQDGCSNQRGYANLHVPTMPEVNPPDDWPLEKVADAWQPKFDDARHNVANTKLVCEMLANVQLPVRNMDRAHRIHPELQP